MARLLALAALCLCVLAAVCSAQKASAWKLLWNDEFTGRELNRAKWEPQIGNGCQFDIPGWGNNEKQWYTDVPKNLRVENGKLVLQALYDASARKPFTSARVRTYGKFAVGPTQQYKTVRIEARIKVPRGLGIWPAFWLLPADGANMGCSGCGRHGVWAASGEIDVMELANDMKSLQGTLHFAGEWPANAYTTAYYELPGGASFADNWHTYRLDWTKKQMRWYVDGKLFSTKYSGNGTRNGWFTLGANPAGHPATAAPLAGDGPFDQKFYIILNLALGTEGTQFTTNHNNGVPVTEDQLRLALQAAAGQASQMQVDWVRVYGQ